jgi:RNA polymerase sigma-70 factor (ECF subfamily)
VSALTEHRTNPDDAVPENGPGNLSEPDAARTAVGVDPAGVGYDAAPGDVLDMDDPAPSAGALRTDFGAHFEAHYQRLVAQLYAITLDSGQAHTAVQDAYARAWRRWSTVGRLADPAAWVRSVAVRSTIRNWRTVLARFGVSGRPRRRPSDIEPRTNATLDGLSRLPVPERRALVLTYMAGLSIGQIAAVEQVTYNTVQARLLRSRRLIAELLADDLPALLESTADWPDPDGEP